MLTKQAETVPSMDSATNGPATPQAVEGLYVELQPREQVMHWCVLCGNQFVREFVAVALMDHNELLGDLCIKCLRVDPPEVVERTLKRASEIWQNMDRQAVGYDEKAAAALLAWNEPLPARDDWDCDQRARSRALSVAKAMRLISVAERLIRMPSWSITLREVRDAERAALKRRRPTITPAELKRLIDDRYKNK